MAKGDIDTYYEDGQWKNKIEGNQRASGTFDRKSDAQSAGRERAIRDGREHVIKNMDGTIGAKNTYPRSRDQNPPLG
ncbi:DUF2188 domain-containing protein [Tsukamurella tyrosinosolvens]|uniref:DUF2188 domain-containing protein n=1 Tax=Tsukamurella tyrosinosolvens TaxID=57704 RepID=UPI0007948746|nr:DUF2188 domain-containing protein [Tsukamurella tyrosinosolvens]KXP04961.1 hypothetical protein AXK59_15950 [Tsukamurella tyrosinosolvens]